jgi:hypothetical protein
MVLKRRKEGRHPTRVVETKLTIGVNEARVRHAVLVEGSELPQPQHWLRIDRNNVRGRPELQENPADQ